jgi:chromate transporter
MLERSVRKRISLWEIARTFLIIGATGFGGGMAIIAYVQDICVARLKWLSLEEYSHGVAFGQILGAFAVNAVTFVGYRMRGLAGAIVAVISFLAPSIILVIGLAALYSRFSHLSTLQSALKGISPVVVALIVNAAYQMGSPRYKEIESWLIALTAFLLFFWLKMSVIGIMALVIGYGIILYCYHRRGRLHEA